MPPERSRNQSMHPESVVVIRWAAQRDIQRLELARLNSGEIVRAVRQTLAVPVRELAINGSDDLSQISPGSIVIVADFFDDHGPIMRSWLCAAGITFVEASCAQSDVSTIHQLLKDAGISVSSQVSCATNEVTVLSAGVRRFVVATVGRVFCRAFAPVEIVDPIADPPAMYFADDTRYECRPDITAALRDEMRRVACAAHVALGCTRCCTTVLLDDASGGVIVTAVDMCPGLYSTGLFSLSATAPGTNQVTYADLIKILIDDALSTPPTPQVCALIAR